MYHNTRTLIRNNTGALSGVTDTVGKTGKGLTDTVGNTVQGAGKGASDTVNSATKGVSDSTKGKQHDDQSRDGKARENVTLIGVQVWGILLRALLVVQLVVQVVRRRVVILIILVCEMGLCVCDGMKIMN